MHKLLLPLSVFASISLAALRAQDASPTPTYAPAATQPPSPAPAVTTKAAAATETIVFLRHGEKPADDKGQLTCRGLNRALALPHVLVAKFGKPGGIFAPLTLARDFHGKSYSYVRPLMTIEPTAIMLGLPVDTRFAVDALEPLRAELTAPGNRGALIFVAWEHKQLVLLVRRILEGFGDFTDHVPDWPSDDYDSLDIVKIRSWADHRTAAFSQDHEQLDGLSDTCPTVELPAAAAH
jgi:hypothetical protein